MSDFKRALLLAWGAIVAWSVPPSARALAAPSGFDLTRESRALATIVVAEKACPASRQAAEELQQILHRITGARFEVQNGDGSRGIVVGTLEEFPSTELAEGLAIRNTYDGREAYAIRSEPSRLRLIGATGRAVPHAVVRLLDHVGYRHFFPSSPWEIVPASPSLSVRLDVTERPAILARRVWYGYGYFDHDRCDKDYYAWCRHNRMGGSFGLHCGHAWQSIIATYKKDFDAHPEYLALVKDKRQGPQFCVSRPEVRKLVLDYARAHFQRHPEADMVSLETSDGGGHCECDACRRLGSISDRVFGLANEVARELGRTHPGKMVGLYAYNDHCEPPSFELAPNVYVQSTAGFITGRYTFDDLVDLWPKRCRSMGFYDYYSVWLWDFDMPPGGRGGDLGYIRRQIQRYAQAGATSLDCESGNNWGPHGLGYYLAGRLMWSPQADADAIVADFLEKAFGPAAGPMRRYYSRLDPGSGPLISTHLLGQALRDLQEATVLAKDRGDVLARLDHLKQYQRYVRLKWEHDRAAEKDRKRELALAIFTHVFRNRHSYMNHWEAMRQEWLPRAAKDHGCPNWVSREPPWKALAPTPPAQTQQEFEADLAFFQPQDLPEKAFSQELVPAGLPARAQPAATSQRYQGGGRYVFLSEGKPVEMTVTTGLIAWYRDRPEAAWRVCDGAGTEIAKGRLPQDGKEHPLSVAVPRPGLYWLEFNDQSAGWGIQVAAGRAVCLELRRGARQAHMGHMQRMHFFVPGGTKEIVYFWEGGPHDVYGPDGKLVTAVTSRGTFVRVGVPAGADGKAWSMGRLCLGRLWFLNVPNYLAASPEALLVPKEAR